VRFARRPSVPEPLVGARQGRGPWCRRRCGVGKPGHYGIDDGFINSLAEALKPNTSALFVLVRKAQPEKVLAEMSRFRDRVIRSSLSPEQESRLQAALTVPEITMPGSTSSPVPNPNALPAGESVAPSV